jgi:exonuclease III
MRRHFQQMSKEEKAFVHGFVRANAARFIGGCGHYYDRASERSFSGEEVAAAIKNGLVVEVHNDRKPEIRALVRDRKGTCVVVSLSDFTVITVYYNDPNDQHETLNWNVYNWQVNLVNVVKELRKAQ